MGKKNIVCFGDSNTYGYSPAGNRFENRYAKLLKDHFADENVYEEGIIGRTTIYFDTRKGLCSFDTVDDVLSKYDVIDCLIVMLGTNDYKIYNARNTKDCYDSMTLLIDKIKRTTVIKKIILVSPIALSSNIGMLDKNYDFNSYLLSLEASSAYSRVAYEKDCYFLDAKEIAYPSEDGEHFSEEGHYNLAKALIPIINRICLL